MEAFLIALDGAGPYLAVFILGGGVVFWLLKEITRIRSALDKSNERLLDERDKRANESLETAKLLSDSTQKVAEHTKVLDKVLERQWNTHSPA